MPSRPPVSHRERWAWSRLDQATTAPTAMTNMGTSTEPRDRHPDAGDEEGTADDDEHTARGEEDDPAPPLGPAGGGRRADERLALGRQRPQEEVGRDPGAARQGEHDGGEPDQAPGDPEVARDGVADARGPAAAVAHERRPRRPGLRRGAGVGARPRRDGLVGGGHGSILTHVRPSGPASRGPVRGCSGSTLMATAGPAAREWVP